MKNTVKAERKLALRTHTIRDLTAEDLRLAVGGRSGSAGSGSAGSGSAGSGHHASGSLAASQSGGYGFGSGSKAMSS